MPAKSRSSFFTSRGNHFGNLWAVYSTKTSKVLLLGSDRQLAHWLLELEFSPSVASFQFNSSYKSPLCDSSSRVDYHFEVSPSEGVAQLHFIRTEGYSNDYSQKKIIAESLNYKYIEFNDQCWMPQKQKILPLLKLSSFLSSGRHVFLPPNLLQAASEYVCTAKKGLLGDYISHLSAFDSNLSLLLFCRMYSGRKICADFECTLFSRDTCWWLNE